MPTLPPDQSFHPSPTRAMQAYPETVACVACPIPTTPVAARWRFLTSTAQRRPGAGTSRFLFAITGVLMAIATPQSHAQAGGTARTAQHHVPESANALVKVVRESTARFHDVAVAEAEGYHLLFGCVSGPDWGAMGLHYVNLALVGDGELDPAQPEIVIYEPTPSGQLKLVGADYLVFADAWDQRAEGTPQLMGQLLHLFESPNRFGLPAFYTLHVWAWKENPTGMFVNWHSRISCEGFSGQVQ